MPASKWSGNVNAFRFLIKARHICRFLLLLTLAALFKPLTINAQQVDASKNKGQHVEILKGKITQVDTLKSKKQLIDSLILSYYIPPDIDSIPSAPSFQSLFQEKFGKTIDRLLWFRFGPKMGVLVPSQPRLIKRFNEISYYISVDFIYSKPESSFGPAFEFYSIANPVINPIISGAPILKRDHFIVLAPSYGYQHFFHVQPDFLPYIYINAEYHLSQLRVNEENINVPFRGSLGTSFGGGALFSNRFKLNLSYLFMKPLKGYSLNGFSSTLAYMFDSVHLW